MRCEDYEMRDGRWDGRLWDGKWWDGRWDGRLDVKMTDEMVDDIF